MLLKWRIAVLVIFFCGVGLTGAGSQTRNAYSNLDKTWIEGLWSGNEGVSSRLARALGGVKGSGKDDVCGCAINVQGDIVDPTHCPVVFESRDESMAKTKALAIVSPMDWAWNLACFKEGAPGCKSSEGVSYIGETCCKMVDPLFARGKSDLNFYVLAPAPVIKRLASYRYGDSADAKPLYESCNILVDDRRMLWSLPQDSQGFVARTWLYAVEHYGANSPYALGVLRRISTTNPPSSYEIDRAKQLSAIQSGRGNREILGQ